MPSSIKKLRKCENAYQYKDNLLALKWSDRRKVTTLSTIHEPNMVNTGKIDQTTNEQIQNLICVTEYNGNRGSVVRLDAQISYVECVRKIVKWDRKLFLHLLKYICAEFVYLTQAKV